MKTLLTTLNSKYIHSNLAIRYLKAFCADKYDIEVCEYTINDNINNIISDIYLKNSDIIAFSCYIWNIEMTLKVISSLKMANKNIKIILGGPEVSYDPKEFLQKYKDIDYIIFGEGEYTFKELLEYLNFNSLKLQDINGLAYRENEKIIVNNERELIKDLDVIKFPYECELNDLQGKMVYYESSRGCPFNCQYCLSSTIQGVRYFSLDRVKNDLEKLINAGVSQVKFVDRTFNCHKGRTIEIIKFILDKNPQINFHFEIAAELLDDDIIDLLKQAPQGLFQLEIGVQSTNKNTLGIIKRNSIFDNLSVIVNKINSFKNMHLHLDLIAGLPNESYESFKNSFNDVYSLRPQMLQLGFLKLLRGSGLRNNAGEYEIKYNNYSPYEVISTKDISFDEIIKLKEIEEILEKYYNSNRFSKTIEYITKNLYSNPFEFYEVYSTYWRNNNLFSKPHSLKNLYTILINFIKQKFNQDIQIINELLKFDFLSNEQNYFLPDGIERNELNLREQLFEVLKNQEFIDKYLPQYKSIPAKQIIKKVHMEVFEYNCLCDEINNNVILFNYDVKTKTFNRSDVYNITRYVNLNI